MPVREDGRNFPPFFYQRDQVIIVCVWFYRHVKIRSRLIVVAPPESKLFGLLSMNCIATHFYSDVSHDDLLCVISCVACFVGICVRSMGIVAASERSRPLLCNGPLRSSWGCAVGVGAAAP